jgi:hypothetical protein
VCAVETYGLVSAEFIKFADLVAAKSLLPRGELTGWKDRLFGAIAKGVHDGNYQLWQHYVVA